MKERLSTMNTNDLIQELQRLPVQERMYVTEKLLHSIRTQVNHNQMQEGAEALYQDYKNDRELTAFTNIDLDNFYEAG
jgi:hypothetical protein